MKQLVENRQVIDYNGNSGLKCHFCGSEAVRELKFDNDETIGVCFDHLVPFQALEFINS